MNLEGRSQSTGSLKSDAYSVTQGWFGDKLCHFLSKKQRTHRGWSPVDQIIVSSKKIMFLFCMVQLFKSANKIKCLEQPNLWILLIQNVACRFWSIVRMRSVPVFSLSNGNQDIRARELNYPSSSATWKWTKCFVDQNFLSLGIIQECDISLNTILGPQLTKTSLWQTAA